MIARYMALTFEERKKIESCLEKGYNLSQVAKFLKKSPTTIIREYDRYKKSPEYNPSKEGVTDYCAEKAQLCLNNAEIKQIERIKNLRKNEKKISKSEGEY